MAKKLNHTFSIILVVLSIIHIILTPMFYKIFNLGALWFAGSGLSFLFLGSINIIGPETTGMPFKLLRSICNALALVFCALIVSILTQPQAFICLAVVAMLLGLSLLDLKRSRRLK